MSNQDHKKMGDEEYQYPNEEYVTETTPAAESDEAHQKQPPFFVRMIRNNKRVTLVVVIAVVALIAFKLLGSRHHDNMAPTQPVVTKPVQQPVISSFSPRVVSELGSLKQDEQTSQSSIGQLQNQIQDLRDQLNQATTQQTQANQVMVALARQVKQLTEVVQASTQKAPSKPAARKSKPPVVFHLKAIVPGRAWIISNDGLSESVAAGDTIPQYGTVQMVDANRGMVLTSSGKVIGYGSDDH